MQDTPGQFLTLEGGEGVGKSTQIETLRDYLSSKGIEVLYTREPGGTALGEAIRDLLLAKDWPAMHEDTELLLMFAARAEHLQQVIKPALMQGRWVVSDRFTDATYAYQGGGRGISEHRITILKDWVQHELRPDFTLLLDAKVEIGLARARSRGDADRFEQEAIQFFEKVRRGYLAIARQDPQRVHVVDASQTAAQVRQDIVELLDDFINRLSP